MFLFQLRKWPLLPVRDPHLAEAIASWRRPVNHPTEPDNNPTVAHEHTDADSHAITQFGIALAFLVVVSQLGAVVAVHQFFANGSRS